MSEGVQDSRRAAPRGCAAPPPGARRRQAGCAPAPAPYAPYAALVRLMPSTPGARSPGEECYCIRINMAFSTTTLASEQACPVCATI
eukprot:2835047-Pyramimonas_sp.AAC.3